VNPRKIKEDTLLPLARGTAMNFTRFASHALALITGCAISGAALAQNNNIVIKSLDDLDKCAANYRYDTGVCMEPLEKYAKGKSGAELFAIGKRARLQFTHWAALRFFDPALGSKPTAAQCADEDLALAVISGLALPPDRKDKAVADRIFGGACFGSLSPAVEKEVNRSSGGGYLERHACPIFATKKVTVTGCQPKAAEPAPVEKPPAAIPKVDLKTAQFGLTKVYVGAEGERVAVTDIQGQKGAFAIRFSGFRSSINDKTIVHLEEANGGGFDYVAELEGGRWYTVRQRRGDWTVYAPGIKDPIRVGYSDRDTKAFDKESLRK
jgi:hypothetical protein